MIVSDNNKTVVKMANGPMARMNELDQVEKEIVSCLHTSGKALEEIR